MIWSRVNGILKLLELEGYSAVLVSCCLMNFEGFSKIFELDVILVCFSLVGEGRLEGVEGELVVQRGMEGLLEDGLVEDGFGDGFIEVDVRFCLVLWEVNEVLIDLLFSGQFCLQWRFSCQESLEGLSNGFSFIGI